MNITKRREKIDPKIPDIKKLGQIEFNKKVIPKYTYMNDAFEIVKNYIIKNKRKVYGGMAIHFALIQKDPKYALYDETVFPDYDFYSPEPLIDIQNITNLLLEAGYKNVIAEGAVHNNTYKIKTELFINEICDISYSWIHNYNNIPFFTTKDGIRYVAPQFQIIDTYKTFIDPLFGWLKIEKNIKRASLLEDLYLYNPNPPSQKTFKTEIIPLRAEKYKDKIFQFLKNREDIVIVDSLAYNMYIQQSHTHQWKTRLVDIDNINIYAINAESLLEELLKFLKIKLYKILYYQPLLEHYSSMIKLQIDECNILTIFSDDFCIPYKTIDELQYGSYHVVLRILYIQKYYSQLINNQNDIKKYNYMINNLQFARETYFKQKKLLGIEDGIFQELQAECKGDDFISPMTKYIERKLSKKQFYYDPTKAKKILTYVFPNTSGKLYKTLISKALQKKNNINSTNSNTVIEN